MFFTPYCAKNAAFYAAMKSFKSVKSIPRFLAGLTCHSPFLNHLYQWKRSFLYTYSYGAERSVGLTRREERRQEEEEEEELFDINTLVYYRLRYGLSSRLPVSTTASDQHMLSISRHGPSQSVCWLPSWGLASKLRPANTETTHS